MLLVPGTYRLVSCYYDCKQCYWYQVPIDWSAVIMTVNNVIGTKLFLFQGSFRPVRVRHGATGIRTSSLRKRFFLKYFCLVFKINILNRLWICKIPVIVEVVTCKNSLTYSRYLP